MYIKDTYARTNNTLVTCALHEVMGQWEGQLSSSMTPPTEQPIEHHASLNAQQHNNNVVSPDAVRLRAVTRWLLLLLAGATQNDLPHVFRVLHQPFHHLMCPIWIVIVYGLCQLIQPQVCMQEKRRMI